MSTLVLINTTSIVQNGQSSKLVAGDNVSDAGVQASLQAAGGVLAPATDANIVAAQAVVVKARSHGADEAACNAIMMAAYAATSYGAAIQEVQLTVTAAQIVALGAALTGTLPFAAALPAGARFVGAEQNTAVVFAGTSTLTAEIGDGTTATEYMAAKSLQTLGILGGGGGAYSGQSVGGKTPTVTFTSTGTDLNTVTGGPVTFKVFYWVMP